MILRLERTDKLQDRTIGKLYINGVYFCDTLEDIDRGLNSSMSLEEIQSIKQKHDTAIPTGNYKIVISHSPRFNQLLPLLLNVVGFMGIRIHPGNNPAHTSGCLLVGKRVGDLLINSRATFRSLLSRLKIANKYEQIIIEIV